MEKNEDYVVVKDIPLDKDGTKKIPANTSVTMRWVQGHKVYFMDGGQLPQSYQEDFDNLIDYESKHGWKYIVPVRTKTMFTNSKEGL